MTFLQSKFHLSTIELNQECSVSCSFLFSSKFYSCRFLKAYGSIVVVQSGQTHVQIGLDSTAKVDSRMAYVLECLDTI